jgi:CBS domain-containing protein
LRDEDTFEGINIYTARVAKDLMHKPIYVFEDEDVLDVLQAMVEEGLQELPIVNKDKKVTGDLNCLEIISALWEK